MIDVKPIPDNDFNQAFAIVSQLRPHLDAGQFARRVAGLKKQGYLVFGAYLPELAGYMGLREVETLARGRFLHIDDLIVDKHCRQSGVGSALINFAKSYGLSRKIQHIFLDSFPESLDFYLKTGFSDHGSILVKSTLF